jgi:hypothetical protein
MGRGARVPHRAAAARAQTESGATKVTKLRPGKPLTEEDRDSKEQFLADFYQIITGYESSELGIAYELIHSDSIASAN